MTKLTNHPIKDEQGFTILELIIATAIATGAILMLMLGTLSMSTSYTKGLTMSETQNTAQNVINVISQALEFGDPTIISVGNIDTADVTTPSGWFCANNTLFAYTLGQEVVSGTNALVESGPLTGGCPASESQLTMAKSGDANYVANPTNNFLNSQELLGTNMRLTSLTVSLEQDGTYEIIVGIAYGNDSVFAGTTYYNSATNTVKCRGMAGDQFCATASLQTYVEPRIVN